VGLVIVLALVIGSLGAGFAYADLTTDLPSLDLLPVLLDPVKGQLLQPTQLYDRTGEHLLLSLDNPGITRKYLYLDPAKANHLSPVLVQATLAIAEPDFWHSSGYSLAHLTNPEPQTIAERLVLDLLLWQEPANWQRALRMRLLAAQVTAKYGRAQVLEWYLNSTDYGHLAFGAESAAQLYLGKSAADVTLTESAVLVAAADAPQLNPLDAPDQASQRQQAVLDRMLTSGAISTNDYTKARLTPATIHAAPKAADQIAPAFTRLVLSQLTARYGQNRVQHGGFRIITTLDYDLQAQLYCTVQTQLARLENQPDTITLPEGTACQASRLLPTLPPITQPYPSGLQTSGVVYDPQSGQVLALLGDTTLAGQTDSFTGHAPGSLLTPFVAMAGFVSGYSPANLMWDVPSSLPEDLIGKANPDGSYHGPVRLRVALANDYLVPVAQLLEQLGTTNTWRLVEPLGITGLERTDESASLLFNGGAVTPLEIAQAYGVFADEGVRVTSQLTGKAGPATVLSILDSNDSLVWDGTQTQSQAVLSAQLAYLVHNVLSDESARWPSLGHPNALEIGRPSGAKLGQTDDGQQVWSVGYTPQRLTVVWLGMPAGDTSMKLDTRPVAGVEHAMLQYATNNLPAIDWAVPAGIKTVQVCDPSGLLPTVYCPNVVNEVFIDGNDPTSWDDLYQQVEVDRETGRLATVFTPPGLVEERTYLIVPQEARSWAQAAGLSLPPTQYDNIQPPETLPDAHITSPSIFAYVRGSVDLRGTAAGDNFTNYRIQVGQGINPTQWLDVGSAASAPVEENVLGKWDTTGLNGLYAVRLLVQRSKQQFDVATIQVTVDNTAPQASIPYPQPNQTLTPSKDGTLTLQVNATDNIGISRVEWWLDNQRLGEVDGAPYALAWQAVAGQHVLFARVYDLAGNMGESQHVTFTVGK
jgi:membrane peptidoglycan carboxypeptidase